MVDVNDKISFYFAWNIFKYIVHLAFNQQTEVIPIPVD